jgi:hypothetical protein
MSAISLTYKVHAVHHVHQAAAAGVDVAKIATNVDVILAAVSPIGPKLITLSSVPIGAASDFLEGAEVALMLTARPKQPAIA